MELIFWFSLLLISSSYFGYPLALLFLSVFFGKKTKQAEITPLLSMLIPAYNEEKVIAKKLDNCLSLDYPGEKLEIIVASESTDATNEIVSSYQKKGIKLFAYSKREGQSALIYKTFSQCRGEIVLLTDANAIFKKDALKKIVRNFSDSRVGCVCGQLVYTNPKNTPVGRSEGIYWRYEMFLKKLESRLGSVLGANGSIHAIRKKAYFPLGKYRSHDFEVGVGARQHGYQAVFEPEAISFEQSPQKSSQEFKRKVRNVSLHFRTSLILFKKSLGSCQILLLFQLFFHKILRWLVPIFLILAFASNVFLANILFYQLTMIIQIVFYLLAIFGAYQEGRAKKLNHTINFISYFSMVNLAVLMGLLKAILGKQKPYWEKVR